MSERELHAFEIGTGMLRAKAAVFANDWVLARTEFIIFTENLRKYYAREPDIGNLSNLLDSIGSLIEQQDRERVIQAFNDIENELKDFYSR